MGADGLQMAAFLPALMPSALTAAILDAHHAALQVDKWVRKVVRSGDYLIRM